MRVYWVNYSCQEVLYSTLQPGQTYVQASFAGSIWNARDVSTNQVLLTHRANGAQTVQVR